jgi:hypothetical protein
VLNLPLLGLPVTVIVATAGGWVVRRAFEPVERMAAAATVAAIAPGAVASSAAGASRH